MYVSLRGAILALIGGVSQRGDSDLNDARQYIAEVISDVATLGYFVGDDADPASLRAKASELYRAADYLTSLRSTAV